MTHRAVFRRRKFVLFTVLLQKVRELAAFVKRRLITQDADLYQCGTIIIIIIIIIIIN